MSEIFVTSDHHFDHKNILKYQPHTRPFNTVEEMESGLISRHNHMVGPKDEVYFLGDFAFASEQKVLEILEQMNGRKYFIFGNHDKVMRNERVRKHFEWMKSYHELRIPGIRSPIPLFHYPIFSWNRMHFGAYHFYGHTHGQIPYLYNGLAMDIGVDTNDCYPYNVADLIARFEKIKETLGEDAVVDARGRDEIR